MNPVDHPETIVAVATPEGEGGLAVVRLSGPRSWTIADAVFKGSGGSGRPDWKPGRVVYGILTAGTGDELVDDDEVIIDEVLMLPFRAPRSYTGEDAVEFTCHGGRMAARLAVSACRSAGAVPAAAGEFTRRAFLNGKLSLDQAEAVADLIHAGTPAAARTAVRQLLGGLDAELEAVERPLLELLAQIEGSLEFTEEEDVAVPSGSMREVLASSARQIAALTRLAPAGRMLRDGVHVVLAGPTNAGKSSLFNRLLEEDRAIVDAEAGTTRDVVTGSIIREGTSYVFHDTAGLRSDPGRVEKMGMDRTARKVAEADIVLQLSDSDEWENLEAGGVPVVRVRTKWDLQMAEATVEEGVFPVSSLDGRGIDSLWSALDETVDGFGMREAMTLGVILNERHLFRLEECRRGIEDLLGELENGSPGDEVIGSLLSSILGQLGEISGRVFSEQVLESVFRRFCVGK